MKQHPKEKQIKGQYFLEGCVSVDYYLWGHVHPNQGDRC